MERKRSFAVAAVVLCLLGASGTLGVLMVPSVSPCHDRTLTVPQTAFTLTYNSSTETLSVIQTGGDRLTEGNTNSLTIQISPEDGDTYSTRYVLASDSAGGYPVADGDEWMFTDASINGRSLSAHDVVRVMWAGPDDIPSYCPNDDENVGTLAKLVIGDD